MKIIYYFIIGITVFCTIAFTIIQSDLIFQCMSNPNGDAPIQYDQCEEMNQNVKVVLGLSASACITAIVCMITVISPKKGIILVMSIAGSLILLFAVRQTMFNSIDPPGIWHSMEYSNMYGYNFATSPLCTLFLSVLQVASLWI